MMFTKTSDMDNLHNPVAEKCERSSKVNRLMMGAKTCRREPNEGSSTIQ
jgi:hypothetical protein